jgi:hypothetical protein
LAVQERLNAVLADQHAALLANDFKKFSGASERRAELVELTETMVTARDAFRRCCATVIGSTPERITLSQLIQHLAEPWSTQTRNIQSQLRILTAKNEALLHRTAAILAFCDTTTRGLLAEIGADEPVPDRYGPGGVRVHSGPVPAGSVSGVV